MNENIVLKRAEMYAMINSIENDIVTSLSSKLGLADIPCDLKDRSHSIIKTDIESLLRGLDLQGFIEIFNCKPLQLGMIKAEKDFINNQFVKIIPIRNKIMHPRLLDFYDYPIMKECFEKISEMILFVDWISVEKTKVIISQTPEKLILPWALKKSDTIIENIPYNADFEETSFIGRRKEVGELKDKLYKPNVHILSIIGNGGVGKTAIAVKLLYDLLDEPIPKFEVIIWASLKTRELSNFEFAKIGDSILSASEMYKRLEGFVGKSIDTTTDKYIIDISKSFKTLLVLDNLETINTNDIKEFLDEFTENGKVLITSRIGLGEMEHRYKLDGMNEEDLSQYFSALLDFYGLGNIYSNEEKLVLAKDVLYSNALAVKWFVRGLYNGLTEEEILRRKEDVINFCMSDVYDKLSDTSKNILDLITLNKCDLTFAELLFYMDCITEDDIDIRKAINELIKCNFIDLEKFASKKLLSINDFPMDFLVLNSKTTKSASFFDEKRNKLRGFSQYIINRANTNPCSVKCISSLNNDITRIIAAYYLHESIKYYDKQDIDGATSRVEFAKKLSPDYFECYKYSAYLYASMNPSRARDEYESALKLCQTEVELFSVRVHYAGFLLMSNQCIEALEQLELAAICDKNNIYIKFEQAKIYSLLGRFIEANQIIESIDQEKLSVEEKNEYYARKSNILLRQSETIDKRDFVTRFELLMNAFEAFEKIEAKTRENYDYMAKILINISYINYYKESVVYLAEKLEKFCPQLRNTKDYKNLRDVVSSKITKDPTIKNMFTNFLVDYRLQAKSLDEDKGIVYEIRESYGFITNVNFPRGIYFSRRIEPKVEIGDIVRLGQITNTERGPVVSKIEIVGNENSINPSKDF